MAAGEDQPQPVISQLAHVRLLTLTLPFEMVRRCRVGPDQQRQLAAQRLVAAQRIQGASAGGGGEPGAGVGGDAALGPGEGATKASWTHSSATSRSPARRTVAASTNAHW